MAKSPNFEIPEHLRQIAEQQVAQARTAYDQFVDMSRQAQEMAASSQGEMVKAALDLQSHTLKCAERNAEAGFQLASELAKAKDAQDFVEIQTKHAQAQMQAFTDQAQELGRLIGEVAGKTQK